MLLNKLQCFVVGPAIKVKIIALFLWDTHGQAHYILKKHHRTGVPLETKISLQSMHQDK